MLALIAGEGSLPRVITERLERDNVPFRFCELEGHPSEARGDRPIMRFRVEQLGSFIADLKRFEVQEVCFAGAVARPKLDPSAVDAATMPLVPRMLSALQSGDDGALRLVMGFFEEAGIKVRAAHDIVPDLYPKGGVWTKRAPDEQAKSDVGRGIEIIGAMAQVDVGQACIVASGQAIAIEAIGGTDWMMRSLLDHGERPMGQLPKGDSVLEDPIGFAAEWLTGTMATAGVVPGRRDGDLPPGGVLVKAAKPGQDTRIDMPTVGPLTVLRAAEVGLTGIAIEAERVMVLDVERCVEIADRNNLFFWVCE